MLDSMGLYARYAGVSVRSQLQYRGSVAMMAVGHFLITGVEFLAVWTLFHRFTRLGDWNLREVALLYGLVSMSFALSEALARGFDVFPGVIRRGDFDRVLLRPRSTVFQISASEVQLLRIGRFTQGLIVFLWAAAGSEVAWSAPKAGLAVLTVAAGALMFSGLFILGGVLCFWSTESLEIVNISTYGGVDTAKFPISIYPSWFRRIFTFVIPLACVTYFPALAILSKKDALLDAPQWFQWGAPLLGIVFYVVCLQVWHLGVRHYRSTGS